MAPLGRHGDCGSPVVICEVGESLFEAQAGDGTN